MELLTTWFYELGPVWQAFFAGTLAWITTAIGAAVVYMKKEVSVKFLDFALGFAAGVMIAATIWSLLEPSMSMSESLGHVKWLPATVGFLLGAFTIRVADAYVPHLHLGMPKEMAEGVKTKWRRATLLVMAITLHNIPEGLAVGVLFGAAATGIDPTGTATVAGAVALAIGISIQNLPEGMAVSMPLRGEGVSRGLSFNYGQLSGLVNPPSAVIGALAVIFIQPILPYALGFAAGAMIFVVVEELIPTSQRHGNTDLATLGTVIGFCVMMVLDVTLG
ncbi:ZIP family metal transporter [Rhodohalobacter sp. SW132]|uniref:ZIP family metal transporter n=1 Tax=Rhodohalobacter sp. SW132 TaxID=2293433 RepID=UPI000E276A10|nr:ZIP family metal transporter [Rhodohalobacter sp. SW132]REL25079.1 ZIP family metal transporter [Rhodohalobacter sp. SW132]